MERVWTHFFWIFVTLVCIKQKAKLHLKFIIWKMLFLKGFSTILLYDSAWFEEQIKINGIILIEIAKKTKNSAFLSALWILLKIFTGESGKFYAFLWSKCGVSPSKLILFMYFQIANSRETWRKGRMCIETGLCPVFYPVQKLHFLTSSESLVI